MLQKAVELFAGKHGSNPFCNYIGKKLEALKTKGSFHEETGVVYNVISLLKTQKLHM